MGRRKNRKMEGTVVNAVVKFACDNASECRNTIKSGCFCNKLGNRKEYHTGETLGMFFESS